MHKQLTIVLFLSLLYATTAYSAPAIRFNDTTQLSCKTTVARQLGEIIPILKKRFYKKEAVQWDDLFARAKEKLENATGCKEAQAVIDWCFSELDERHSFLLPPAKAAVYNYDTSQLDVLPTLQQLVGEIKSEIVEDAIGYLLVPWISTTDESICNLIADSLQHLIAGMDKQGVNKWIIDLRTNRGGNCWPMLAGLGPLLGNGVCGYFVTGNNRITISYKNGAAYAGATVRCRANKNYTLTGTEKWIVLLTGPQTSSSGELLALAFRGMQQVYYFGEPTAGLVTANSTYELSDRSMLVVTVCREADRHGRLQVGKIMPEQLIYPDPKYQSDDVVKKKAVMWLQSIATPEIPALKLY